MGRPRNPDSENMRQVPIRIHENDYKVLKKLMLDDGLTLQKLTNTFIQSYLRADASALKILKQQAELNTVPKEVLDRYNLSQRERQKLIEQIEEESKDEEVA